MAKMKVLVFVKFCAVIEFSSFLPLIVTGDFDFKTNLEDELFRLERSEPASEGDDVFFRCIMPFDPYKQVEKCLFKSPHYRFYTAPDPYEVTNVTTFRNKEITDDIVALPSGELMNVCGLLFRNISKENLGQWKCASLEHYTPGTFYLLDKDDPQTIEMRLPQGVIPDHYDIHIFPDLDSNTTIGNLKMTFKISEDISTSMICLNSKNTAIDEKSVSLRTLNFSMKWELFQQESDFDSDIVCFSFDDDLPTETFLTLELRFKSYLNNNFQGFFKDDYYEDQSESCKRLVATHFEPNYARQAFPCLDEPDLKATFSISITHKTGTVALSNMNVVNREEIFPGHQKTWFQKSVKMSSYLVAFVVAEFESTGNNETFKVWHQLGKSEHAKLAAESGQKILTYFENLLYISSPVPKMDLVALAEMESSAMENWGLVTFREKFLLFEEDESDSLDRQKILEIISHELAHQWFGNLVTMKWWNETWLNEGFASYFAHFGVNHVFPESRPMDQVVVELQNGLRLDSSIKSPVLCSDDSDPSFNTTFRRSIYRKGSSILRMIEHVMTLDTFMAQIIKYLQRNKYGNVDMYDLIRDLNDSYQMKNLTMTIGEFIEDWILEPGYPVVTVAKVDNTFLSFEQERFFVNPEHQTSSYFNIPISIAYPGRMNDGFNDTSPTFWMSNDGSITFIEPMNRPYVINVQQTGFYRVNYDEENWCQLASLLRQDHSRIHLLNRAQILDDSFNLAVAGKLSTKIFLELAIYLHMETEYVPWERALDAIEMVDKAFSTANATTCYGRFRSYVTTLLIPIYQKLGFEVNDEEDFQTKLLRMLVLSRMCKFGYKDCINKAQDLFVTWMKDPERNKIHPDLREVVYRTVVNIDGNENLDFLKRRLDDETSRRERDRISDAIKSFRGKYFFSNRQIESDVLKSTTQMWNSENEADIISEFLAVIENWINKEFCRLVEPFN